MNAWCDSQLFTIDMVKDITFSIGSSRFFFPKKSQIKFSTNSSKSLSYHTVVRCEVKIKNFYFSHGSSKSIMNDDLGADTPSPHATCWSKCEYSFPFNIVLPAALVDGSSGDRCLNWEACSEKQFGLIMGADVEFDDFKGDPVPDEPNTKWVDLLSRRRSWHSWWTCLAEKLWCVLYLSRASDNIVS